MERIQSMKRINTYLKNRNFFMKLFITLLLMAMIPVSLLSMLSSVYMNRTFKNEIKISEEIHLRQTANAFEMVMKQINDSCNQLFNDPVFHEYTYFFNAEYYDSLNGDYNPSEVSQLYKFIDTRARLVKRLNVLKLSNEYVESVYYINLTNGAVITDEDSRCNKKDFYDGEWISKCYTESKFPLIMDPRMAKQSDNTGREVITIVYKSFSSFLDNTYAVAVNLNVELMKNNIIGKLMTKPDRSIVILSSSGEILIGHVNDNIVKAINTEFSAHLVQKMHRNVVWENETGNLMLNAIYCDRLNWVVLSVADLRNLNRGVYILQNTMWITTLVLIIAILFVSVIAGKKIYNPIIRIIEYAKHNLFFKQSESCDGSEVELIWRGMENACGRIDELSKKLDETLPVYRDRFLTALLKFGATDSMDRINEKMEYLAVKVSFSDMVVVLLSYWQTDPSGLLLQDSILSSLKVRAFLENSLKGTLDAVVTEFEDGTLALILNCRKGKMHQVFDFMQHVKSELDINYGFKYGIGIGRYSEGIYELERSYREAAVALKYSISGGMNDIVYYEDIATEAAKPLTYPEEKEQMIYTAIMSGNAELVQKALHDFFKEVFLLHDDARNNFKVNQVSLKLLYFLLKITTDLGIRPDNIFSEQKDLYGVLMYKDGSEIIAWFQEVVQKLTRHIADITAEKKNKYVGLILKMMQEDCGSVSLNYIAEKLKISPVYVSKIFKENTGKNFSDYVTTARIEKSKLLLEQTDMTVKEIGEIIGYSNSNYFIKIFKDNTGLTPGKYRDSRAGKPIERE